MKNSSYLVLASLLLTAFILGCNLSERMENAVGRSSSTTGANANSNTANKSITERAMDTAVGEEMIGIPECDDALELLARQASNPEDGVITQALKKTALNRFRAEVKRRLDEKKANPEDTAKFCREFASTLAGSTESNANTNH